MARSDVEEYSQERAFLEKSNALLERELERRARRVAREVPRLADEVAVRVATPVRQWTTPVDLEIAMEFRSLKVEEAVIADLLQAIEDRPLPDAIERRSRGIERDEKELIHREPGGAYLLDSAFWRDEDALNVLSRLFTEWARWVRGQPLEGP